VYILEVRFYKIVTISISTTDFTHPVILCNKNKMKSHHTSSNDSSKTQSNLHYQAQNKMLTIFLFRGITQLCVICINCIKAMWRESVWFFTRKLVKNVIIFGAGGLQPFLSKYIYIYMCVCVCVCVCIVSVKYKRCSNRISCNFSQKEDRKKYKMWII
jgi:magnesium-transporting ATPase (P-type)